MILNKMGKAFFSTASPGRPMSARFISVIVILLIITLFAAMIFIPAFRKFVIIDNKSGKILYFDDVKPGDKYIVSYTHSVNKSPVDDVFQIQDDYSILLKKTVFRAFGVGIPSEPEGDQSINIYKDRTEIDNINMPVREHLVFVGIIADHTFTMHGKKVHLNQLTAPQRTVRFEVRRIPLHILLRRD